MLRIRGTSRDGQIVRLRSAKCTIGSSRDATLRLVARCVRPIHCLILRGQGGTVIRRWSPDTLLNGGRFSEAPLTPGDRIAVGPIELEVLDPSKACPGEDGGHSADRYEGALHNVLAQTRVIEQRTDELQQQQVECLRRCEELEHLVRRLETRRAEPTPEQAKDAASPEEEGRVREMRAARETTSEKPSERAPLESTEVFRRMGISIPEDSDDSSQEGSAEASTPTLPPAAPTDQSTPEEESLDDYMARLMERVRDRSWKVGLPETLSPSVQTEQSPSQPAETKPVESSPLPANEPLPQSVTPEKRVDLTRLRELANLSAQQAIHTHNQKHIRGISRGKLVLTLSAGLVGGLLLVLSRWLAAGDFVRYAGALGLLAAIVWGVQYAVLTGRLIVGRKGGLEWNSLPVKEEAAPQLEEATNAEELNPMADKR